MLGSGGDAQTDAELAVGDLSRRAGVLTLNPDGMAALLDEPGVIDDPRLDRLALRHRIQRVASSFTADALIAPRRVSGEVKKPLMSCIRPLRIRTGSRGNRLDTLPLTVAEQAQCVNCERLAPLLVAENRTDPLEVLAQPHLSAGIHEARHAADRSCHGSSRNKLSHRLSRCRDFPIKLVTLGADCDRPRWGDALDAVVLIRTYRHLRVIVATRTYGR